MTIQVKLFAVMAQRAGVREVGLELPNNSSASAVRAAVLQKFPDLSWPAGTMLAVNQEYAGPETALRDGDEVAIIPPVSGG